MIFFLTICDDFLEFWPMTDEIIENLIFIQGSFFPPHIVQVLMKSWTANMHASLIDVQEF